MGINARSGDSLLIPERGTSSGKTGFFCLSATYLLILGSRMIDLSDMLIMNFSSDLRSSSISSAITGAPSLRTDANTSSGGTRSSPKSNAMNTNWMGMRIMDAPRITRIASFVFLFIFLKHMEFYMSIRVI